MSKKTKCFGVISGILAFIFCFAGGVIVAVAEVAGFDDSALWLGIGLYFIGQAFFVGPMLIIYCIVNSE